MIPMFMASLVCRVMVIPRGENPLHFAPLPAGPCAFCCPIDLDRDVEFRLFTRITVCFMSPNRRNPLRPSILRLSDSQTLRRSNFNVKHPTVVYIHGYSDSASGLSSTTIRNVYLKRGEYNVILVNWMRLAVLPWYVTAVENTKRIGPHVARMVSWLDAHNAVPLSRIHVIGFSLGAEIAGFMGKALAPRKVGRITGLDAAYPLYMNSGMEGHLTATDAMFVDVIHTDGGRFGFPYPIGHVDFYPNGGKKLQPGCNLGSVVRRSFRRIIRQYIVCGHNRAWRFYAESVSNPTGFPASRCPKWRSDIHVKCMWTPDAYMGFAADTKLRGMFYLRTNAEPPYARNHTGYNFP